MVALVVKAFAENDEVKAHYQEKFQYVLVDEYRIQIQHRTLWWTN